jgi:hypothetical protein
MFRVRNVIKEINSKDEVISEEMYLWGYRGAKEELETLDYKEAKELLTSAQSKADLSEVRQMEDIEPSFHHVTSENIPSWTQDGVFYRLLAGEAFGRSATVPIYSPLFLVEMKVKAKTDINLTNQYQGEIGFCVVEGSVNACEQVVNKGSLLVSKSDKAQSFIAEENSHLLLFGGMPLPEPRFIKWNFVSSDKVKINEAELRWKTKDFTPLENDHSYIPMPQSYQLVPIKKGRKSKKLMLFAQFSLIK